MADQPLHHLLAAVASREIQEVRTVEGRIGEYNHKAPRCPTPRTPSRDGSNSRELIRWTAELADVVKTSEVNAPEQTYIPFVVWLAQNRKMDDALQLLKHMAPQWNDVQFFPDKSSSIQRALGDARTCLVSASDLQSRLRRRLERLDNPHINREIRMAKWRAELRPLVEAAVNLWTETLPKCDHAPRFLPGRPPKRGEKTEFVTYSCVEAHCTWPGARMTKEWKTRVASTLRVVDDLNQRLLDEERRLEDAHGVSVPTVCMYETQDWVITRLLVLGVDNATCDDAADVFRQRHRLKLYLLKGSAPPARIGDAEFKAVVEPRKSTGYSVLQGVFVSPPHGRGGNAQILFYGLRCAVNGGLNGRLVGSIRRALAGCARIESRNEAGAINDARRLAAHDEFRSTLTMACDDLEWHSSATTGLDADVVGAFAQMFPALKCHFRAALHADLATLHGAGLVVSTRGLAIALEPSIRRLETAPFAFDSTLERIVDAGLCACDRRVSSPNRALDSFDIALKRLPRDDALAGMSERARQGFSQAALFYIRNCPALPMADRFLDVMRRFARLFDGESEPIFTKRIAADVFAGRFDASFCDAAACAAREAHRSLAVYASYFGLVEPYAELLARRGQNLHRVCLKMSQGGTDETGRRDAKSRVAQNARTLEAQRLLTTDNFLSLISHTCFEGLEMDILRAWWSGLQRHDSLSAPVFKNAWMHFVLLVSVFLWRTSEATLRDSIRRLLSGPSHLATVSARLRTLLT